MPAISANFNGSSGSKSALIPHAWPQLQYTIAGNVPEFLDITASHHHLSSERANYVQLPRFVATCRQVFRESRYQPSPQVVKVIPMPGKKQHRYACCAEQRGTIQLVVG